MSAERTSRDVALAVVRDVFGREARGAQAAFDFRVRRAALSPRDRGFAAELAYGAIKMRRTLDWLLRPYVGGRASELPAPIGEALRLGAYQLRFMHGVDAHAAVFETVGAALRVGHRGTAGLVNAVLRRLASAPASLPERAEFNDEDEYLGTRYSVPDWLAAQWRARFGDAVEAVLAGVDGPPQLSLRVNALRESFDVALAELDARGVSVRPSAFAADALIVQGRPDVPIRDDAQGRWALQGEASCIPADLLAPQPGETVADLCSGRGNKAIQLAARMNNAGTLTCVELDERAAATLDVRLAQSGVTCARVVRGDARDLRFDLADAVLVDPPCSATGVLGRHPEARWRKRPDDAAGHAATQRKLLDAAARLVRPGGRLAYAVCSTDEREGDGIIEPFLRGSAEFARAPLPERYAPLVTRAGDVLVPPGIEGRDGFYVALLRRADAP